MELRFQDYELQDNKINFTIPSNTITGITGNSRKELMEIIDLNHSFQGKIFINEKEVSKKNIVKEKKKISIVENYSLEWYSPQTIYERMYREMRIKQLDLKNPRKKILDSLKIVGLSRNILEKSIYHISSSEKKKIEIAISLIANPSIIVLEEPFKYLDKKGEKSLFMLLEKIKEKYNKTIVFVSDDSNILYKYTEHVIIAKNHHILIEGETREVFTKVYLLKKNKIRVPEIVYLTYKAKKNKNVKIDYHKDVRDIIKDIYKHV